MIKNTNNSDLLKNNHRKGCSHKNEHNCSNLQCEENKQIKLLWNGENATKQTYIRIARSSSALKESNKGWVM